MKKIKITDEFTWHRKAQGEAGVRQGEAGVRQGEAEVRQ
ncbi:hypothetical protein Pcinc_036622, partial [Petrolisthes cinctipes]